MSILRDTSLTDPADAGRRALVPAAVLFYALCVTIAFVLLLERRSREGDVSAAEARADRERLGALAERVWARGPRLESGHQLTLTFASQCGAVLGALSRPADEPRLWFTIDEAPRFYADPRLMTHRSMLLLARHAPASDILEPESRRALFVGLSREPVWPKSGTDGRQRPRARRREIDNLRDGRAAVTVAGRNLAHVGAPRRCAFAAADVRTFALLARTLQVRACEGTGRAQAMRCKATRLLLWRDAQPQRFAFEALSAEGGLRGYFDVVYAGRNSLPRAARWVVDGRGATSESPLALRLVAPDGVEPQAVVEHDPAAPRHQEFDVSLGYAAGAEEPSEISRDPSASVVDGGSEEE